MFCGKCGGNVDNDAMFCPVCGTPVGNDAQNNVKQGAPVAEKPINVNAGVNAQKTAPAKTAPVKTAPAKANPAPAKKVKTKPELTPEEAAAKKKKIKKIIIGVVAGVVAAFVALIAAIIGLVAILNPANKVLGYLEDGEYSAAVDYYYYKMGEPNNKLVKGIDERLDDIWTDYQDETMEYVAAYDELAAIQRMDIYEVSEKLDKVMSDVSALEESRTAFKLAQEFESEGNDIAAIAQYRLVIETDANYEAAKTALDTLVPAYKKSVLDDAAEYAAAKDYEGAVDVLSASTEVLGQDSDIVAKLKAYETTYETSVLAQADELLKAKKYDDAVLLLEKAKEILTDDTKVDAKITEVNEARPVALNELVLVDSEDYEFRDEILTDSFGYKYECYHFFDPGKGSNKKSFAIYNLDKKYTSFTASVVANPKTQSSDKFSVVVLVDDKITLTIDEFTKTTGKKDVSVDVTGATKLEIRITSEGRYDNNHVSVVDAYVGK